jgi:predicted transcriptional regulator of viral defense system
VTRQMDLVDNLVADGRDEFTFADAKTALGVSTSATANALRQLGEKGLVDRVARGHYVIRPLGSLGTSAAAGNLSLAVGAAFEGRKHRIAYLTALSEIGLLSHPVRTVYVACTQQVRMSTISRRPLRVIVEKPETIHLEAEVIGHSWRSTLERALFESALRVDQVGGVERLAEALVAGSAEADPLRIERLVNAFGARGRAAERRLASLAHALNLSLSLNPDVGKRQPVIRLDPRDSRVEWNDSRFRVLWNVTIDELQAVIGN